jgi:hypothetical protein
MNCEIKMTINILNKTKLVKKNINGKMKKCLILLCFKCEEYIGNEFKIYESEETENYVCEDCVPVAELLKRKKTEDKWAKLTKKILQPKCCKTCNDKITPRNFCEYKNGEYICDECVPLNVLIEKEKKCFAMKML